MPSTVTAYDVRIVPAGDAASFIAREVLAHWNERNTLRLARVLIARIEEPAATSDLLLAFYCPSRAAGGCTLAARLEAEIEAHVRAGRPVFVYCSDGRRDLTSPEPDAAQEFSTLHQRYGNKITVATFGDEKEFRAILSRHLDETLGTHPYFRSSVTSEPVPVLAPPPVAVPLSELARVLLVEACADPEAYIGRVGEGMALRLQANGRQLVEPGKHEAWAGAFGELITHGFIRDVGCQGRLFQISAEGFAYLKTLGIAPVGYIAELGGM